MVALPGPFFSRQGLFGKSWPILVDGDNFLPLVVAVSQAAGFCGAGHEEAG